MLQNTVYHEAVPGHHFQMAIAQELQGIPTFRKVIPFEAFHEGWATYAERVAFEQGLYRDPYSRLYRLSQERSVAGALVLDTGIHYKRWSRQQATDYALAHGDLEQREVENIILPRIALMPGQSCAYKIGAMRIVELREKARRELGTRFDVRDFHDVALRDGAMPLTILEKQVQRYIQTREAAAL